MVIHVREFMHNVYNVDSDIIVIYETSKEFVDIVNGECLKTVIEYDADKNIINTNETTVNEWDPTWKI